MLGTVILTRFDLWPALLSVAALAALAGGRERLGLGVLGLAVSAKIYPAVLLPIALLYVARRRGGREALVGLGIFAAVLAAVLVPFAVLSWDGLLHAFTEQARRPLQIESLGSSVLLAVADLGGYEPTIVSSFGSQNLSGQLPDTLAGLQTAVQIVAVVAVWILFAISRRGTPQLLAASAAAVAAFAAFGKVLSPQFLIWLIPLVALVLGRLGAVAWGLFALALALTHAYFPEALLRRPAHAGLGTGLAPGRPERRLRRPGSAAFGRAEPGRAGAYVTSTRTVSQAVARPSEPQSISAPSIRTSPSAGWNRTGKPLRMRSIASSARTPITESCGPVMPASVSAAVPPEDPRVVRLHVRVRSDHGSRPAVEHAGERDLLARRFGVEVDDHDRCLAPQLLDELLGHGERVRLRLHEQPAHEVEHRDKRAVARGRDAGSTSRSPGPPKFAGRSTRSLDSSSG